MIDISLHVASIIYSTLSSATSMMSSNGWARENWDFSSRKHLSRYF